MRSPHPLQLLVLLLVSGCVGGDRPAGEVESGRRSQTELDSSTPIGEDGFAPAQERAGSSPIFVNRS